MKLRSGAFLLADANYTIRNLQMRHLQMRSLWQPEKLHPRFIGGMPLFFHEHGPSVSLLARFECRQKGSVTHDVDFGVSFFSSASQNGATVSFLVSLWTTKNEGVPGPQKDFLLRRLTWPV